MIVAVAADLSLPPQQSPMLGQRASSHTVCRFRPLKSDFSLLKFVPVGMEVLSHVGSGVCAGLLRGFDADSGWEGDEPSSRDSDILSFGSGLDRKSPNDGPELSLSVNLVLGFAVGGIGSGVVAKLRFCRRDDAWIVHAGQMKVDDDEVEALLVAADSRLREDEEASIVE